jgi:hypothetical protein
VAAIAHTMAGSCTRTPQMPAGRAMLAAADVEKVRSWVQAGAMNN